MLKTPDLNLCVKCGSCKALCPTNTEFMNEGMSSRGRVELLKKLFSGEIETSDTLDERIFSCLLCGSCNGLCPLGISVTDAVYEGRRILSKGRRHWLYKAAMKYIFTDTSRAMKIFRFLEGSRLLSPLSRMEPLSALRELGIRIPATRFRDGSAIYKVPNPKGRIAVFTGCTVDYLFPSMGLSLVYTLNALDFDVVIPKAEVCCGAPLLGSGLREEAALLAEKNLNTFRRLQAEAVISLCPTCTHFIKDEYVKLIGSGIENAMDMLNGLSMESVIDQPAEGQGKVVFHDPCHSLNYLGIREEPRRLLKMMGFSVSEPAERGCCGLGGTVRLLHGEISKTILRERSKALLKASSAEMVVTSCPNCVLQLQSGIKERPVKHIIEIIAANMKRR